MLTARCISWNFKIFPRHAKWRVVFKLGFIGELIRMEYPPCDTLPVGGGALDAPFTDGL